MKLKRIFGSALVATSVFGLAACGEEEVTTTEELPVEEIDPKDVELIPHFEDLTINDIINFLQYTDFDTAIDNIIKEYQQSGKYLDGNVQKTITYNDGSNKFYSDASRSIVSLTDKLAMYSLEDKENYTKYTRYTNEGREYAILYSDSNGATDYGISEYNGSSVQQALKFLTQSGSLETISQYASMFESYKDTAFEYIMPYINGDANLTDDIDAMMNQTVDLQKVLKVLDPFVTTGTEEVEKPLGFINVNVTLAGVKISIDHAKVNEFVKNFSDSYIGEIVDNLYPTGGDESRSEVIVDFLESPQFQEAWYTISNLLIKAFGKSQSAENQVIAVPADGLKLAKVSEIATPTPKEMDFVGMVIDLPYVIESILKGAKVGDFADYFDMLNFVDVQAFSKFDNKLQLSGIEAKIDVNIPDLETETMSTYSALISSENDELFVVGGMVQEANSKAFANYLTALNKMNETDSKSDLIDIYLDEAGIMPIANFSVRNDEDTNVKLIDLTLMFTQHYSAKISENSINFNAYNLTDKGEKNTFIDVNAELTEQGLVFGGFVELPEFSLEFDNNHLNLGQVDGNVYKEMSIVFNENAKFAETYFTMSQNLYKIENGVKSNTAYSVENVIITKFENGVNIFHTLKDNNDDQTDNIDITFDISDKATLVYINAEGNEIYTTDDNRKRYEYNTLEIKANIYSLDFEYKTVENYYYADLDGKNKTEANTVSHELSIVTEPTKLSVGARDTYPDKTVTNIYVFELSDDLAEKQIIVDDINKQIDRVKAQQVASAEN